MFEKQPTYEKLNEAFEVAKILSRSSKRKIKKNILLHFEDFEKF